ncbi:MAG TPA: hypothetical protein VFM18_01165, partial [Methanosarcina sp.]|nr:hypothetical protein [Methanosarcina sp.]
RCLVESEKRFKRLSGLVSLTSILAVLSLPNACTNIGSKQNIEFKNKPACPKSENKKIFYVPDTFPNVFDQDLHVAAGNIWTTTYVDSNGEKRDELTAGLLFWLTQGDDPVQGKRVRLCDKIEVYGYEVEVLEMESSGVGLNIERVIKP